MMSHVLTAAGAQTYILLDAFIYQFVQTPIELVTGLFDKLQGVPVLDGEEDENGDDEEALD